MRLLPPFPVDDEVIEILLAAIEAGNPMDVLEALSGAAEGHPLGPDDFDVPPSALDAVIGLGVTEVDVCPPAYHWTDALRAFLLATREARARSVLEVPAVPGPGPVLRGNNSRSVIDSAGVDNKETS